MSSVLETLGNLGDFVGGIAVVFSLVYLAVQIRQNTNAVRASSWQSVVAGARSVNQGKADPQVQRSLAIGLRSDVFPTFEDQARFNVVMSDEALQFQSILALYLSGQLDEATYRPYLRWFASFAASPGGRAWWDRYRDIWVPAMVDAVEARIAEADLHDVETLAASPGENSPAA